MRRMPTNEEIKQISQNASDIADIKSKYNIIENIVDSEGNPRFVEDDASTETISGVTFSYAKWSLSGTHLMIVLAGSIENATTIASDTLFATFDLPEYIADKIYPVWSNNIEVKGVGVYAEDWTNQLMYFLIRKNDNALLIKSSGSITTTDERNFRVQFDLLIDAEASE